MVWCGYLGWLSLRDIRKRAIPLWMLSAGGLPVLLGLLRNGWNVSVITALLPGGSKFSGILSEKDCYAGK